jgi:hypothetical protein
MRLFRDLLFPLLVCATAALSADPPDKDTLLFQNGEKLIGKLLRSGGGSLTFRSDSAGEVTVPWTNVKELRTASRFAVVEKDVKLGRHEDPAGIPQGRIAVDADTIVVQAEGERAPARIPVKLAAHLIDERTFERAARDPGVLQGWRGTVTAGASLVEATQHGRTFTGAISLVRPIPAESWLPARNRTTFDFNGAYGVVTQSQTASKLKTEIYRVAAEHDVYFTARFFAYGQSIWDHNFSQGLDLQQSYGGGIGWTILKSGTGALDVKAGVTYLNERFTGRQPSQDLVGSTFAQTLQRRFKNGISLAEQISVTPTWNNRNSYAAQGNLTLTVPVYKRVSFTIGTIDTFLNNPTPGFLKNSFQFTTGLSYTLPPR